MSEEEVDVVEEWWESEGMMREGWTGREMAVERVVERAVELWDKKLQYLRLSVLDPILLRSY